MKTVVAMLLFVTGACSAERAAVGTDGSVHGPGVLDPASPDFHGKFLAGVGWNLGVCATCHDPARRGAAPACESCHADGPTGCASCHGLPPTSGAHLAHASSGAPDSCRTCHPTPTTWRDAGHLGSAAVLAFAPIAGPKASFDGTRCNNVYCHGASFVDAAATNTTPAWNGGPSQAACGTCHGDPPAGHVQGFACAACHPADAPHVDGIVQVGGATGCNGCHGSAASPAPPVDLSGHTATTALGVGAHQAHLLVPSGLRGPIACSTCHLVPTAVDSPGHIDHGPPAVVDASLGWDRVSATCAAWCHGGARPVWTTTGGAACGSCHGVPPAGAPHTPAMKLTDCATCHPGSVDADGFPIVTDGPDGPTSEHINGHVDF